MKTILIPIDLSPASSKVVKAGCQLASRINARLVLLHVHEPAPTLMNEYQVFDAALVADFEEKAKRIVRSKLAAFSRTCAKNKIPTEVSSFTGSPRRVIAGHARKIKASYIVIGSHGHTAAYDLLIGSTTQKVLRDAKCPVLVVPVGSA